jgi:hypothetical protein
MSNPPDSDPHPPPTLTPEVVEDDVALGEWVDDIVLADMDAQSRMHEIARLAEAMRAILDEDKWRLFMTYDERANARFAELLLTVCRWAFSEGRWHPMEPT